jgi:hypothetical protein
MDERERISMESLFGVVRLSANPSKRKAVGEFLIVYVYF